MLPSAKVYGTTGQLTADDLDKIDNAVPRVPSLSTKATAPKVRIHPTMAEIHSLEDRLTKHQLSSARIVSGLQMELKSQSQTYERREKELQHTIAQSKSLLPAHKTATINTTVTGPPTVIDMADDAS